jgi:hypothetical protein
LPRPRDAARGQAAKRHAVMMMDRYPPWKADNDPSSLKTRSIVPGWVRNDRWYSLFVVFAVTG